MDVPDFYEEDRYNAIARFFHWTIAFLIVFMLGLGLSMGAVDFGIPRTQVYDLHKSTGLVVLLLALGRIVWRFASVPPDALDAHAPWERTLARAAHTFLYIAIICMPLSGWLMSDAAGRPPTFFGLNMPRLLAQDESLRHLFGTVHVYLAWGLIFVIGLHVAGALKHHIIDKDATLRRMAGARLGWFKLVAVLLLLDGALMAGAFLFLKEAAAPTAAAPVSTQDAPTLSGDEWRIDPAASRLTFQSSAFGTAFTGRFDSFTGTIAFDPDNLPMARADITIDMAKISSGDAERDGMMQGADWFAVENFPQSRFTTHTIQRLDPSHYIAIGDLTIRDVTMPVSLPFTLNITEEPGRHVAHMQGQITLDRLDFGVGQGEWERTEVVPAAVSLSIDLKAVQPR